MSNQMRQAGKAREQEQQLYEIKKGQADGHGDANAGGERSTRRSCQLLEAFGCSIENSFLESTKELLEDQSWGDALPAMTKHTEPRF